MSKLLVTGRKKLDGEVEVQGAKNSALPIIAASILTKGENVKKAKAYDKKSKILVSAIRIVKKA